jgi:sulfotransferase family protein
MSGPVSHTSKNLDVDRPAMPVIVGSPRSGTTLLRFMLDSHPEVAIPPETGFLSIADRFTGSGDGLRRGFFDALRGFPPDAPGWTDFGIPDDLFWSALLRIEPFSVAEGYRAFYRVYAARFAKNRWGDKTPMYCLHIPTIEAVLPEAHFIHVIRDGRDVALSLRNMWFSPGPSIEAQAEHWHLCVSTARQSGARCRNYCEVRFEDLVRHGARALKGICGFLGLEDSPELLRYHVRTPERLAEHRERRGADGSLLLSHADRLRQQALVIHPPLKARIGTWRRRMSADEQGRFEEIAGGLLQDLGYETSGSTGRVEESLWES